jgi:hypothetical protein
MLSNLGLSAEGFLFSYTVKPCHTERFWRPRDESRLVSYVGGNVEG